MTSSRRRRGPDREKRIGFGACSPIRNLMAAGTLRVYRRQTCAGRGDDQKQHSRALGERDIRQEKFQQRDFGDRFRTHVGFGDAFFPQPAPLIQGPRDPGVMSLRDGHPSRDGRVPLFPFDQVAHHLTDGRRQRSH